MGCTYNANTVLGLRIEYDALASAVIEKNTRVERGCEHDVPEGQRFCGICGAEREVTIVPRFYLGDYTEEIQERNPGISVASDGSEDTKYVYIGFRSESGEYDQGAKFEVPEAERIEALKAGLRDAFIPVGLWDPRNFGIWTFLYVGC